MWGRDFDVITYIGSSSVCISLHFSRFRFRSQALNHSCILSKSHWSSSTSVSYTIDYQVNLCIISVYTQFTSDGLSNIINVRYKKKWSKYQFLVTPLNSCFWLLRLNFNLTLPFEISHSELFNHIINLPLILYPFRFSISLRWGIVLRALL